MKYLVVLTSCEKYPNLNKATGLWLGEATHFCHQLQAAKIQFDFVSPRGGYVPIDPTSLSPDYLKDQDFKFYNCPSFRQNALGCSKKPSDIKAEEYCGIYYTGGHGVVFDFLENKQLQEITSKIYEKGGIISSVCHGTIGLLNVKSSDGKYLIEGKKITGFSNEEEDLAQLTKHVPYLTENEIKKRGANYINEKPFTENVLVDGQFVTGQNPQSAGGVGRAVAKLLKK